MKNYFLICATLFALASCATKSPEESAKEMAIEEFKKNLNDPSSFELVEWTGKTDTIYRIANHAQYFNTKEYYTKMHSEAINKSDYDKLESSTDTLIAIENASTEFTSELELIHTLEAKNINKASNLIILDLIDKKGAKKEIVRTEEGMKYRAKNALNATILSEAKFNWKQYIKK